MVGSVLMGRMQEERDFDHIEPVFFTTSNRGRQGPGHRPGRAAAEGRQRASTSCKAMRHHHHLPGRRLHQRRCYPKLRAAGWKGYWIDAASTLRMKDDAIIILDPVNMNVIKDGIDKRREELHRRQLHRVADADRRSAACSRPG
ncbi:MAG: hypothetical protein MZW92_29175 [Comamonadaceae bacterium]|nr:hypothetical protein [Comamonadaceae bacterium]